MSVSYNRLWKLLIDKNMSVADMRRPFRNARREILCFIRAFYSPVFIASAVQLCCCNSTFRSDWIFVRH